MPDFYADGEYDLSGFAVGSVKRIQLSMGNIAVDSFLTASFRSHACIKKLFDFGDRGNIGSEQLVINYDGQTNKGLLVDDHSSNSPNSAEVDGRVHLQAYTIPVEAAEISSGRVSAITMASKNVEGNSVRSLNVRGEASTVYSAAKLEDRQQLKLQRRKESNR